MLDLDDEVLAVARQWAAKAENDRVYSKSVSSILSGARRTTFAAFRDPQPAPCGVERTRFWQIDRSAPFDYGRRSDADLRLRVQQPSELYAGQNAAMSIERITGVNESCRGPG